MSQDQQQPDADPNASQSGDAGLPDQDDVPAETIEQLESDREERLDYDPQDRPFAEGDSEAPEPASKRASEPGPESSGQTHG